MPRPKEYDDDLRLRLLEAAATILADEGAHAVTTRRVAGAVGTSTTAIYSLIGAKDQLMRAMYREGFTRLADHLGAVPRSADPLADLAALGTAYHRMGIESPQFYNVMFNCPIPEFEATDDDVVFSLSTLQVLIDAVQRAVDEGWFMGDAGQLAVELWAVNHGLTMLAITGMITDAPERLEHAFGAMVVGYRAQARDAAIPATS